MDSRRITCRILVTLFSVSLLLQGCGNNNGSSPNNEETTALSGESDISSKEQTTRYSLPEADFSGDDFTFLVRDDGNKYWIDHDFYSEGETGEPINDAVYSRNRMVEEKFNVRIQQITSPDVYRDAKKSIMSGDTTFDVAVPYVQLAAQLAQEGLLIDLYSIPNLDLKQSWWDQDCNTMTIGNKLFFSMGDINTIDNAATWVVLFNKGMEASLGLNNHYDLVNNGEWTIDKMYEYCLTATKDINGDGVFTPEDQWGAVNQYECVYSLFGASGEKTIYKDENDLPVMNINTEKNISIIGKIYDFLTDKMAQIKADDYYGKYTDVWTEVNVNSFLESRALYYISPMTTVPFFRGMETNFGLIPLPKYDKEQDKYYSTLQYNNATVVCVPQTTEDFNKVGLILEMMAAESPDTLTKAYYDITLKTKLTRDDESQEMLDLIFANRLFDLGIVYNWGSIQGFYENIVKSNEYNFTSLYDKKEAVIKKAIDKSVVMFKENLS